MRNIIVRDLELLYLPEIGDPIKQHVSLTSKENASPNIPECKVGVKKKQKENMNHILLIKEGQKFSNKP